MAPRKIVRVAVLYEDGGVEEWAGTGGINVFHNNTTPRDVETTPPPHRWRELTATLRIDDMATVMRPGGKPATYPAPPPRTPDTDPDHPHTDAVFNGGV